MSTSSSSEYGENIVVNGSFNGNASGWILSGGMKYEDYHIVAEPSAVYVKKAIQTLPILSGKSYLVKYELIISGNATSSFSLGNTFVSHDDQQGVLSSVINAEDTQPLIINTIVQSGKIYITNISVQELLSQSSSSTSGLSTLSSSISSQSVSSLSFSKTTSSSASSSSLSSEVKSSSSSSSRSISLSSSSLSSMSLSSSNSYISSISSAGITSISSTSSSSFSSSSISSLSLSSSSMSSKSSSSISSLTSNSSKSSSSSEILFTSSSLSTPSSLSSSDSLDKGYFLVPFTFESLSGKQIWCFARNENYVYAGTGPCGKIIRSLDYYHWEEFETVNDSHIRSLFVWSNGLFVGTEPHGKIYVYNFSSEMFYNFVQTEDSCVTCFAEYNNKLYVGTSPLGVIYQFDGETWKRIYQANGNGINSMTVYNNLLYIYSKNTEFAVMYDGSVFKIMPIRTIENMGEETDLSSSSSSSLNSSSSMSLSFSSSSIEEIAKQTNKETFYSFRNNKYEPLIESKNKFLNRSLIGNIQDEITNGSISADDVDLIKPTIGIKSILSSCSDQTSLYMGSDNGIIFNYPDSKNNVRILYQKDKGKIRQIIKVGNDKVMVAIDNELYLLDNSDIIKTDLINTTQKT